MNNGTNRRAGMLLMASLAASIGSITSVLTASTRELRQKLSLLQAISGQGGRGGSLMPRPRLTDEFCSRSRRARQACFALKRRMGKWKAQPSKHQRKERNALKRARRARR